MTGHAVTARRAVRASRWAAVALLAACLAMIAFSLVSLVLPDCANLPDRPSAVSVVVIMAVFATYPGVGAILAIRRPESPIGWLFLVFGVLFITGPFSVEYVGRAMVLGAPLPGYALVGWLATWGFTVGLGLLLWTALLFPTGHLVSSRWRVIATAVTIAVAATAIAQAVRPGRLYNLSEMVENPVAAPAWVGGPVTAITDLFPAAIAVLAMLSLASVLVRFRRARSPEREQLKWFLVASAAFLVTLLVALATLLEPVFYLAMAACASVAVAVGIAILRYRLYDIDRIISRSIAWTVVTGILLAVFAVVVVGLQAALAGFTQGETLAVAASTLVAFALFQPLRRRVQRAVDRRFDRARVDTERTAAEFTERVRDEVAIEAVAADLERTIEVAVKPASLRLWLREGPR